MAYEPFDWQDGPSGGTPITAERLNHIEEGIAEIELTPGPQGERGPAGADSTVAGPEGPEGPQGTAGPAGADGFPTEEQWNALVARVEALEAAED